MGSDTADGQANGTAGVGTGPFENLGIEISGRLTVEKSPLGGTGLFYDGPAADEVVVARIPPALLYDLPNLTELKQKLDDSEPANSEIVKRVLLCCDGINESEIIVAYMFGFQVALANGTSAVLAAIEFYLKVLNGTQIDLLSDEPASDHFLAGEAQSKKALESKYGQVVAALGSLDLEVPSFEVYFRLNKVVRSRVLEIPHAVEGDGDDFEVNTTLVPFLDFANHSEHNNAFFDVDRATNEVVLKYTHSGGKQEVLIRYNDTVSIQQFVSVYGFIPRASYELFELKLSAQEINDLINKINGTENVPYDKIMKWLEIMPTVQLVTTPDGVFDSEDCNPVPFWGIFSEPFQRLDWETAATVSHINDSDLAQDTADEVVELIRFQETTCDVIQGVDKSLGVRPCEVDESHRDAAVQKKNQFIKLLAQRRQAPSTTGGLTGRYLRYEQHLYDQIRQQQTFRGVLQGQPHWKEVSRIPPSVIYDYM